MKNMMYVIAALSLITLACEARRAPSQQFTTNLDTIPVLDSLDVLIQQKQDSINVLIQHMNDQLKGIE